MFKFLRRKRYTYRESILTVGLNKDVKCIYSTTDSGERLMLTDMSGRSWFLTTDNVKQLRSLLK